MNDPDFWSDKKKSDEAMREAKTLRTRLDPVQKLEARLDDAGELLRLAREENDNAVLTDVAGELDEIDKIVDEQETATLLSGKSNTRASRSSETRSPKTDAAAKAR